MGKVQSKQGECYVVNAHLNPLCQLEEKLHIAKHGITCSELSFAMSNAGDDQKSMTGEKFPLKVILPADMDEDRPEKAEEEKSEKEEKGKLARELSCDVSVENLEKQEFCFTFYDFNGHGKVTKDDVAGLVRSIYDTLRKSVKLPPSGSRTIKVRLAITPEDEIPPKQCPGSPPPNLGSAHTMSTYVSCSTPEKSNTPLVSPATCRRSSPQQDFNSRSPDNRHQHHHHHQYDGVPHKQKHHHRHASSRDHVPECRDRRNHYLDLAGIENCVNKCEDPRYVCPLRILDRSHECGKRFGDHGEQGYFGKKTPVDRFLRYNFFSDARDDLLDLNFDLCDLAPDEKFDWERLQHHRRSKSYDVYETGPPQEDMGSPRTKARPLRNTLMTGFCEKQQPDFLSSPNHHHRHRHRERERQRAMKQVASWIEREHLGSPNKNDRPEKSRITVERHEHHHRHEHVHHHYHHYVDC